LRLEGDTLIGSDEELMGRVRGGDQAAFGELYDRHATRAYRVARSVCNSHSQAEDAVQEGFLSLWRARSQYRTGHGTFQAWAMTTVRRRAIDSLRNEAAAKRPQVVPLEDARDARSTDDPHRAAAARKSADDLAAALRRLPDEQAEVVVLAFFGELSHREIAQRLALPPGTVKGRMRLGLEKLRGFVDSGGTHGDPGGARLRLE
jgi:RNA polymerase sigma-70 factor (ECF subfamily)